MSLYSFATLVRPYDFLDLDAENMDGIFQS